MLKKGFTLVELIMVVALIALISLIAVPNITSMLKKMNDEKYQRFLSDVFLATEVYIQKNIENYPTIVEQNEKVYVYMTDLISSSYLKSSLYDPKNKKFVKDEDYTVEVYLNDDNEYSYTLLEERYCQYETGQTWTFSYTGSSQTFITPCSRNYKVELWGAQGGGNTTSGKGAYTSGIISLIKSNNLYVYVGNMPSRTENSFNGGGQANNTYYPTDDGGGATDIRLVASSTPTVWNEDLSLKSRIMVAGAGGGFEAYLTGAQGGTGGGLIGYDGLYTTTGTYKIPTGGTQISGGIRDTSSIHGLDGVFGAGGNGELSYGGGGGGSGYYGGGGGSNATHVSSGAGGSSYISGHTGCVAITSATDVTPKTGCTTGNTNNSCSLHYSGLIFTNTVMVDGAGYNWTNTKGTLTNMPTTDGLGTMTGNSGNGYAKITLLD